jgi:heme-degrading monooxygenase HmoA
MIARIWHGVTQADKANDYYEYLKKTGVTDYIATPGNRGVYLMRKLDGDEAHFLILTLWDSEQSIRVFAGDEMDKARYYPEDTQFLLELEPFVQHYEVLNANV